MPSDADVSPGLPPSSVMVQSESEVELAAVFAWVAASTGHEPSPKRLWLDDWFLRSERNEQFTGHEASPCDEPCFVPHHGYPGYCPASASLAESGCVVSTSQLIILVAQDNPAWLCDSVRQASTQIQRCPFHLSTR